MMVSTCPTAADLSAFALGKLSESSVNRIAVHVEQCRSCSAAVLQLEDVSDSLLMRLRKALPQPAAATEVVPPDLLQIALDAGSVAISPVEPPAGRLAGRFELLEKLGGGSFGDVYRAYDCELERAVAVKVLRGGQFATPEYVERFLREARSAARLNHPGIVTLHDSGHSEDGVCYIVEELVDGVTLELRLGKGRLEFRQTAELVADLAGALAYAHEQGVVHRDIKPSNIMLDAAGRPHLTDFGLAKHDDSSAVTCTGDVLGTPGYMSPEQARGESSLIGKSSDIYSVGVVLYEMLSGVRPFLGVGRMLLLQVMDDEPRAPRGVDEKIPRDLETICLKAMAKSPARRFASARQLEDDLRRYLNGEPIAARPTRWPEKLARWCRRNPLPTGVLAAVSLGSLFGIMHLVCLSEQLVQRSALESAAMQAEMLEKVNSLYSLQIDRIARQGVEVSARYAEKESAVPLPASFLTELGHSISQSESGMQVRHYSEYPFRPRTNRGPQDDFEREALLQLHERPDQPFYRFVHDDAGDPVLRYTIARRMQTSCVTCHNTHPDSIKKDWKPGEVGGVLEIIRPLRSDRDRIRQGLQGTFALASGVAGCSLSACLLVIFSRSRKAKRH